MKGYFPDESIIVKYFYNQVDIYKGLLQPNNFVCTFPFWEKMILKGILFIYNVAPIPYLNFRHVKSGGKGHCILASKLSFMSSPIAIHTHLVDLQLNLKKETDIDFIACPAFYTICNANGYGQHLTLCLVFR